MGIIKEKIGRSSYFFYFFYMKEGVVKWGKVVDK